MLGEKVFLYFPRNFQLAVQPLPLCHLAADAGCQTGHFQCQCRLRRRPCVKAIESGSDGASCKLVGFNFVPNNQMRGKALPVSVGP
jgi:hypothetical protein